MVGYQMAKKIIRDHLSNYKLNLVFHLNQKKFFKNCNLEVGFGRGDILVHMAKNNPNKNFIVRNIPQWYQHYLKKVLLKINYPT